jgi:bisphosphoglycerate-dependent phosphoglycerate mutase
MAQLREYSAEQVNDWLRSFYITRPQATGHQENLNIRWYVRK